MRTCRNCHWYLMTVACLYNHDMRLGLIGKCEHFMPYCKTEEEYKQALKEMEEDDG